MRTEARPKILIVDDEPALRAFLMAVLGSEASHVAEAADARQALEAIESGDFDIVLSDMYMPGALGLELLRMAKQARWDVSFVLMTGRPVVEDILEALRLQAFDFLVKPFHSRDVIGTVRRAYSNLLGQRQARMYSRLLEEGVKRRTHDVELALQSVEASYQATLEVLVAALDAREHETYAHSFRVRAYCLYLARLADYPQALLPHLGHAALLHDIGKIAVSDNILLKPAKLTEQEWVLMKTHPDEGDRFLSRISFLKPAALIVRHHHERWDGQGYPDRLAGEQIPLGSRLFAFADTLDAMTSDRPYRKAPGFAVVGEEILRCAERQFDPRLAEIFLQVPESTWREIRARSEEKNTALAH